MWSNSEKGGELLQIVIGKDSKVLSPHRRPELVIAFTEGGLQHEFEIKSLDIYRPLKRSRPVTPRRKSIR